MIFVFLVVFTPILSCVPLPLCFLRKQKRGQDEAAGESKNWAVNEKCRLAALTYLASRHILLNFVLVVELFV